MAKYDYLIIGSGLTGAMYAYYLKRLGKCLVMDRNPYIGGLCRTDYEEGIHVHMYGAHIFRTDSKAVWDFVNSFVKFKSFINTPIALNNGRIYNLPFNMNTFAQLFGITTPEEAKRKISDDLIPYISPSNLEEYVLSKLGKTIYRELIEGYTEKQWGKPCRQLPADTMKHIPIRFTYNNNYYDEIYQGIPTSGYSEFIKKLLYGCEVVQEEFSSSEHERLADKIVYTGALDELFNYSEGRLDFRSVEFCHKWYNQEDRQGIAVINYTGKDVPYTRTIEHKHFLSEASAKTIISYEKPCLPEKTGKRIYPVRDNRNLSIQMAYECKIDASKYICCGQQADFKSYNMNQIIKKVLTWARKYKL